MSDIIARKDLGNGLELRVEPSFGFFHEDKPPKYRSDSIERKLEVFNYSNQLLSCEGLDISLYLNEKLCSSPQEYYCCNSNEESERYEAQINRGLDDGKVKQIFIPIIKNLIKNMPQKLKKIYQIFDADTSPINLNTYLRNKYIRLTRKMTEFNNIDALFLLSEKELESEIVENFLVRRSPEDRIAADQNFIFNSFSIYFVRPQRIGVFEKVAGEHYNNSQNNIYLLGESEITIMNISLGYRNRILRNKCSGYLKNFNNFIKTTVSQ